MVAIIKELLCSFFEREKIKYYSCLDISQCELLYPGKLPAFTKSVCFFLVPYYVEDTEKRNVSFYAVPRDYHLYVKGLEERLVALLAAGGTDISARVFADNSPFSERSCAEKAGLGKVGKNRLLITPEYGSFVFIGSICISDNISISQVGENFKGDICGNCEICLSACPFFSGRCESCLSELTQKKRITDSERDIISGLEIKWGCDICQRVCPKNKQIAETPIEFFKNDRIPHVTAGLIEEMSDKEFFERAYSWRGREVIKRNLMKP